MLKVLVDGCEPVLGSVFSACIDLKASHDVVIEAGETKLVGLGVALDNIDAIIENDMKVRYGLLGLQAETNAYIESFKRTHYLQLMLRSSLGKKGLILPNGVGIIDIDYRDEIKMIIHNPLQVESVLNTFRAAHGKADMAVYDKKVVIKKGERIGQIMLCEHKTRLFGIATSNNRTGGFGSTNKDDHADK